MAVNGVLRPGFCQIQVMDIEASLVHYRDCIGLDVVSRESDGRVYLKTPDEFDRHSIILRQSDTPGMDVMGFKVLDDETLNNIEKRLLAEGQTVEKIAADEQPGVGRRIRFTAPTGHIFDLYADVIKSDHGPMTLNPYVWDREPRGMRPIRFDHCLLYGDDIDGTALVFQNALGFKVTEIVKNKDGGIDSYFLTCSNKAHDLALIRCPEKNKFHHCSFLVEDWSAIGNAADIITRCDIPIDIGPTRHGITRGQTIYFFDPSGNRNEVFCGGYNFYPDNPVRVWESNEIGRAIFYYERALNERFLTVLT